MKEKILEAIKKSKAAYTEIRIEFRQSTSVRYRGKNLEVAGGGTNAGGIVRCLADNGGWGISTFNATEDLLEQVEFANECAKSVKRENIEITELPPVVDDIKHQMKQDFRNISLKVKKDLVASYNDILLAYNPLIKDTFVSYDDLFTDYYYANSEGSFIHEERPQVVVALSAMARKGSNVQRGSDSVGKPAGFEVALGLENQVKEAADRAVKLLDAETVKGGKYTVICNRDLAGVFIHEAFGHLSESDFLYENPKAQEMMVMGRKFGREILNVADDGSVPGLRGTHKYDDEGVPTRKNYLIREGKLVGRLHSRETSKKMNEQPTGNARAISYLFQPIVRMTNTFIENGKSSFEDMISDIELGVYACGSAGGQTMLENFSFSSEYAYMIRNGKIEEMVKDVVLGGNLFHTLTNIEAIGNDFKWIERGGGCGKNAQSPLPVTEGSPHIRICDVIMGGR
ncbi:MAG: TldD/PmbA family protein [Planctomycetota bacterium]